MNMAIHARRPLPGLATHTGRGTNTAVFLEVLVRMYIWLCSHKIEEKS